LLVALILICACTNDQVESPSPAPSTTPQASPAPPAVAFSSYDTRQSTVVHYTVASPDGTVIKRVDLDGTGYAAYQDEGVALLLFHNLPTMSAMYMDKTGMVHPVPEALWAAFDWSKDGIGGSSLDGNPVFPDDQTLVGVYGYDPTVYLLLDMKLGKQFTLLTATSIRPPGARERAILLPAGLSSDRKIGRAILRHAKIGSTDIPTWALAEFDLSQHKMSSLKPLPLPSGVDSDFIFSPTTSPDGRFLAYQVNPLPYGAYSTAVFTTHILNLATGQDITVDGAPFILPGYNRLLRFSPDGARFFVFGESPLANGIRDRVVAAYDTSGRLVWRRNVGDSYYNGITPVGWIDGTHFVFTTISTKRRGDYSGLVPHSYIADVTTGSERELPAELGTAVAVLR
jgi:hypothetical protein